MTPEDFKITALPTGDLVFHCLVESCLWRKYYVDVFLWDLLRDAKKHLTEEHDS